MTEIAGHLWSLAADYPIVLFLAIGLLPAAGVPNCPLMIGGGAIVADACGMPTALAMAVGGVIVNILWTYWLAAFPLRKLLLRRVDSAASWLLNGNGNGKHRSVLAVTLALHVTPGVPLFVQSYFPGVHRLPYLQYLAIAIPVQAFYTTVIVGTSGAVASLFNPVWTLAMVTVVIIVAALSARARAARENPAFERGR